MANLHKTTVLVLMLFATITCYAQRCEHVVKRGEDFESIAQTYSITVDELMAANPASSSCYVGRKLLIPYHNVPVERKPVEVAPVDLNLQSSSESVLTKTSKSAYQVGQALYKSKKYSSAIDYLNAAINSSEKKSDDGYYLSCLVMADVYFNGNGVDKDFERAKNYYHEYKNNRPKNAFSDDFVENVSSEIEGEERRIEQEALKEKMEQQRLLAAQRKADADARRMAEKKERKVQQNQNSGPDCTFYCAYDCIVTNGQPHYYDLHNKVKIAVYSDRIVYGEDNNFVCQFDRRENNGTWYKAILPPINPFLSATTEQIWVSDDRTACRRLSTGWVNILYMYRSTLRDAEIECKSFFAQNGISTNNYSAPTPSYDNSGSVTVGTVKTDRNRNSSQPCSFCGGSGKCYSVNAGPSTFDYFCNGAKTCQVCNGDGYIYSPFTQEPARCPTCNGTKICARCNGTGLCKVCNGTGKR